jgi:hypothetical protein
MFRRSDVLFRSLMFFCSACFLRSPIVTPFKIPTRRSIFGKLRTVFVRELMKLRTGVTAVFRSNRIAGTVVFLAEIPVEAAFVARSAEWAGVGKVSLPGLGCGNLTGEFF